jgi:hypothetical protein
MQLATAHMAVEVNDYPTRGANNHHLPPMFPPQMAVEVNDYPTPGANNHHLPPMFPPQMAGRGGEPLPHTWRQPPPPTAHVSSGTT